MAMQYAVLGLFGSLGWPEIVIILVVILLLFGGRKLPELAKGLGKGLRLFKKEVRGVQDELESAVDAETEDDASETSTGDKQSPEKTVNSADSGKSAEDDSDKQ